MKSHGLIAGLALTLAGCGEVELPRFGPPDLCKAISTGEAAAALGETPLSAVNESNPHPQCTWMTGGDAPRVMTAAIWRKDTLLKTGEADSGLDLFATELAALERDYPHTYALTQIGDAAVIGFRDVEGDRFTGAVLVRRGEDVMALRIEGEDPGAFEGIARKLAATM
jgi:hypothetical protein